MVTLSMCAPFFWAYDPHNMNTSPFLFLLSQEMTASVNFSQPLSLWELACPDLTVRQAFSSNTPTTGRGIVLNKTDMDHISKIVFICTIILMYMNMQCMLCGLFYLSSRITGRCQVFRFVKLWTLL